MSLHQKRYWKKEEEEEYYSKKKHLLLACAFILIKYPQSPSSLLLFHLNAQKLARPFLPRHLLDGPDCFLLNLAKNMRAGRGFRIIEPGKGASPFSITTLEESLGVSMTKRTKSPGALW